MCSNKSIFLILKFILDEKPCDIAGIHNNVTHISTGQIRGNYDAICKILSSNHFICLNIGVFFVLDGIGVQTVVGISLGVAIAGIVIIAVGLWCFCKHKKSNDSDRLVSQQYKMSKFKIDFYPFELHRI